MSKKQIETWAPWVLLLVFILLWQLLCSVFEVSEFVFPSPARIWTQFWEFKGIIAGHAWRTFWVTMAGFGVAIVVGVLLGFVIGSSRLAYAAVYPLMTAFNALPKAAFVPILVVWFGIGAGPGHPDSLSDQLLPDHGEHCHRPGHPGAGAGGRAARAGRQALGCAGEGGAAPLHALLLRLAESRHHPGVCGYHGVPR